MSENDWASMKVIRDPNCPPDTMYIINKEYVLMWKPMPKRTRQQRLMAWLKAHVRWTGDKPRDWADEEYGR